MALDTKEIEEKKNHNNHKNNKQDEFSGLFFHGVLEGVEVTPSGEIDGNKYGASVKLNFSTLENITKKVGDEEITTMAKRNFKLSIEATNEKLPAMAKEWNKKINEYVNVKLMPIKDGTYKISK